jgi:cell division protein FtsI (penicillin-binding protein 3)
MSKGFASNYRIVLLAVVLFASFAGLGVRLVQLHVVDREELLRYVANARGVVIPEFARRGDILDAAGRILATSRSLVEVAVDPWDLRPQDESKWPQLAALLDLPLPELKKILTTKYRPAAAATPATAGSSAPPPAGLVINFKIGPVTPSAADEPEGAKSETNDKPEIGAVIPEGGEVDANGLRKNRYARLCEHVPESVYAQIEKLGIKGIIGTRIYRRAYPHGQLAAHVVGYVNHEQRPATGIERYADFYLRGQNGWRESEKDGLRRELAQFRSREVPRADGYSVKLSLDANVQDIVEQELAYIVQRFQPEKATIIVSNPTTGFILGMGNYPTFDLNEYGKVPKEAQASMKNIAVTDILEPGSTFKIISVAAALDEGLITTTDRFNCSLEKALYRGRIVGLPKDDHHWDHELTVPEIVAHSSNRGAAQIGMRLGDQRLYNYARAFGFARPLGFPTGGEVAGILPNPEVKVEASGQEVSKWKPIDITRVAMGHSVAATPLQMHMGMCVIATGGLLMRPQIVKEIRDSSNELVYSYDPAVIGRAVSERTAKTMGQMLMAVASKEGTAPEAAIPGFEVAGKTGTTQMLIDGQYSEKHHIGSFVGFFPASNPKIAITVIVHNADARLPGGWGAKVAAPSFKKIAEQIIAYRGLTPPGSTSPVSKNALALEGGRR